MNLAPIVLFTYKRLDTLIQTVASLQKNKLAIESDLFIFSDAAKIDKDKEAIAEVRTYLKSITGFKSVIINEAPQNKGLATSIIDGVNTMVNTYGKVIVLEDDLVTSSNFLEYMNQALDFYENEKKVYSISGFSIPIQQNSFNSDVYFTLRSSSWGWATWKDKWENIDWNVEDYNSFKNDKKRRLEFNQMGSDMSQMLDRQMSGSINSWAIRWCYHQFKNNLYSVHPFTTKVQNIGFNSEDASNTKEKYNRYETILDNSNRNEFMFSKEIKLRPEIINQFTRPFSFYSRIIYKIKNTFF